jgi:hypothetical protein
VPEQPPLHPVKTDPVSGVAVTLTDVPLAKFDEHRIPHAICDGVVVMVPEPLPDLTIVSGKSVLATALTTSEQVLSSPATLTAVTDVKYSVPTVRFVTAAVTVSFGPGAEPGERSMTNEPLGHGVLVAP